MGSRKLARLRASAAARVIREKARTPRIKLPHFVEGLRLERAALPGEIDCFLCSIAPPPIVEPDSDPCQ